MWIPPYNQRQYVPNYHVLETIARYDSPALKGVTGMRPYDSQRSDFCIKNKVIDAFDRLFRELRVRYIILSYNNEGLVPSDVLAELMQKYAGGLNCMNMITAGIKIKYQTIQKDSKSRFTL